MTRAIVEKSRSRGTKQSWTEESAWTRGDEMALTRATLDVARAHAAFGPEPVHRLMKITPASFELRARPGNNKFRQTFIFVHATLCRP